MPRPSSRILPAVPGVPWMATWDSERSSTALLESVRGKGLRWFNEGPADRDKHGGLWARKTQRIGQGTPEYAGVHPRRQRLAMELLLCHVCSGTSSVTAGGALWMEPITPGEPLVPYTSHPPVCLPCAVESRERCKRIRRTGAHTVRVANPRPWGVIGMRYQPASDGALVPREPVQVGYDDPAVRWVLANQMIVYLDRVTPVDLDEEYAHYLATNPDGRTAAACFPAPRSRLPQPSHPAETGVQRPLPGAVRARPLDPEAAHVLTHPDMPVPERPRC